MTTITTCLLSGGLDSSTALAFWKSHREHDEDLDALHIQYGQRHHRERYAATDVARALDVPLTSRSVPLDGGYSALTSFREVPLDRTADEMTGRPPITYVPMRNSVMLSMAVAHLESRVLAKIEDEGEDIEYAFVLVGANLDDFSGYPDCRPDYYEIMEDALRIGSKMCSEHRVKFEIVRPLITQTKIEVAKLAIKFGLDVDLTWSCYLGGSEPCRRCDACQLRDQALKEARA